MSSDSAQLQGKSEQLQESKCYLFDNRIYRGGLRNIAEFNSSFVNLDHNKTMATQVNIQQRICWVAENKC